MSPCDPDRRPRELPPGVKFPEGVSPKTTPPAAGVAGAANARCPMPVVVSPQWSEPALDAVVGVRPRNEITHSRVPSAERSGPANTRRSDNMTTATAPGLPRPSPELRSCARTPAKQPPPRVRLRSRIPAAGSGNAYAGGAAAAEDASHDMAECQRACRGLERTMVVGCDQCGQFPRPSSTTAASAARARSAAWAAHGGDAGSLDVGAEHCMADQRQWSTSDSASTCPSASTTEYDDGWLGRTRRSNPTIEDDQRQSGGLVSEGHRPVLARRRRELPAFRGDAHQQRQLLGQRWRRGYAAAAAAGQITRVVHPGH